MPSLGNDLATLRNKKGLNLEEVQQITRIPPPVLHSIEDNSIFEQIDDNATYVRSYIRSYAKAIGIREDKIVRALDQIENKSYEGGLITDEENEFDDEDPKSKQATSKSPIWSLQNVSSGDWDWVRVVHQAEGSSSRFSGRTGIFIILLLVTIVAGSFLVYTYFYTEPNTNNTQQPENIKEPAMPSDSLRDALIEENEESSQPVMEDTLPTEYRALPDTLSIAIIATDGKLDPVRIYTDILGQLNPYWIEQGDTLRFNFVNTIWMQTVNKYDSMQLLFNGHVIQNYYQEYYDTTSNMVKLDRSVFENHPEWL